MSFLFACLCPACSQAPLLGHGWNRIRSSGGSQQGSKRGPAWHATCALRCGLSDRRVFPEEGRRRCGEKEALHTLRGCAKACLWMRSTSMHPVSPLSASTAAGACPTAPMIVWNIQRFREAGTVGKEGEDAGRLRHDQGHFRVLKVDLSSGREPLRISMAGIRLRAAAAWQQCSSKNTPSSTSLNDPAQPLSLLSAADRYFPLMNKTVCAFKSPTTTNMPRATERAFSPVPAFCRR